MFKRIVLCNDSGQWLKNFQIEAMTAQNIFTNHRNIKITERHMVDKYKFSSFRMIFRF